MLDVIPEFTVDNATHMRCRYAVLIGDRLLSDASSGIFGADGNNV